MKTITLRVEPKNWKKLSKLKLELNFGSFNQVIDRMLKVIDKFKLKEELKNGN